jgi:hypothetical protein
VGSTVEAVKSVAMPITSRGSTPAAATAFGTATVSTSIQSSGICSAQSGGSVAPVAGRVWSTTPWR